MRHLPDSVQNGKSFQERNEVRRSGDIAPLAFFAMLEWCVRAGVLASRRGSAGFQHSLSGVSQRADARARDVLRTWPSGPAAEGVLVGAALAAVRGAEAQRVVRFAHGELDAEPALVRAVGSGRAVDGGR
ncbi:hypothetical protein [Streptomyces zagrosensis]|uniref:Uncharacterized protein n=1 Tax=Streptomyces zagrosensis TaxID=1042984 RepID=A0A7W9Q8A9_9ACTN|nr:hypothetical protein [Streptomyces zagrosensis]MBB5935361.1 hypothetical protein [Streptomyces zagrosensis]